MHRELGSEEQNQDRGLWHGIKWATHRHQLVGIGTDDKVRELGEILVHQRPTEGESVKPSVENAMVWFLVCAIVLIGMAALGVAIFKSYSASAAIFVDRGTSRTLNK